MHLFTFTERCVVLQSELEMSQIDLRLAKETASLISEFTDCVNVWVIYCFINKKINLNRTITNVGGKYLAAQTVPCENSN